MQIVIDIDEYDYKNLMLYKEYPVGRNWLEQKVIAGTPLPKGHGGLIDTNELNNFCKEHDVGINAINKELIYDDGETSRGDTIWKPLLEVLSTIIEADKESEKV